MTAFRIQAMIRRIALSGVIAAAASFPAGAQQLSFTDLLARAQAQAAAGHRWSPAGDNMTETIAGMMDIIATATPQQLADLSELLEKNASNPPARPAPAQSLGAQTLPVDPAPAPLATTEAASPQSNSPGSIPPQAAARQATPPRTAPIQLAPAAPPSTGAQASLTPDQRPDVTQSTALDRPAANRPRTVARPTPRALELYTRGRDAERQGNFSGARRFFASAAEQGSAAAARSLGRLYDPAYLQQTALGGIDADPTRARHWYERAIAMGDAEAGALLEALAVR
jgi:TPR repeat protein